MTLKNSAYRKNSPFSQVMDDTDGTRQIPLHNCCIHLTVRTLLMLALLLTLFVETARAQGKAQSEQAEQLFEQSVRATNNDLRMYYRQQLAQRFPDTAYGQFALGSLAAANNNRADEIKHYREAIARRPKFPAALNNLTTALEPDNPEVPQLRTLAARYATEQGDYFEEYYVRNEISQTLEQSGWDAARKKQYMRDRLEAVRNEAHQIAYNHMLALEERDTARALALMEKASQFGYSPDSLDTEMRLRVRRVQELRGDASAIFKSLFEVERKMRDRGGVKRYGPDLMERLYLRLTEYAFEFTASGPFLMDLATRTYNVRRGPAVMDELYRAHLYADMGQFKPYLDEWVRTYPDFSMTQEYVSRWNAYHLKDYDAAITAASNAVSLAPTRETRDLAIRQLLMRALEFGEIDDGLELINHHARDELTPAIVDAKVLLLSQNQRFTEAQQLIDQADAAGISQSRIYRVLVEQALQDQKSAKDNARKNPFLAQWDREFGDSLSLGIQFGVNSATIPAQAHAELDKAGRILASDGATPYIFRIEGHTDPSGGNSINLPLSNRRAESVKSYLLKNFDIAPGRLQTVGLGDVQPISSNMTDAGRQRNRRVEILPYGNTQEPVLSTVGYLDARSTVFSKDGRYAAAGEFPIALWDLKQGVRLRELYIGGEFRAFSPNSRFLATMSYSTDVRGVSTPALFITDIKTGLYKMVIPFLAGEFGTGLSWSPDGNRLSFLTKSGALIIVDVAKEKVLTGTPVGNRRISGETHWAKNGHAIFVGLAQHTDLYAYDPETLELMAVIPEVNWVHSMGESDDARVLIVANNDRTISLFDTETFGLIARIPNIVPTPANILAIPGTRKFLMDDKFQDRTYSVFDYETLAFETSDRFEDEVRIGVSPDGSTGYAAMGDSLGLIDLATLNYTPQTFSAANQTHRQLHHEKDKDYLFISDSGGASVWHVSQARMVHRVDEPGALRWKQSPDDKSLWWSASPEGELLSFSTRDFVVKRHARLDFKPGTVAVSEGYIVVSEARQPNAQMGRLAVFERDPVQLKYTKLVNLITEPLRYGGGVIEAGIHSVVIDEPNNRLGFMTWWNNGNFVRTGSRTIQILSLNDGVPAGRDIIMPRAIDVLYSDATGEKHYAQDDWYVYPINLADALASRGELRNWNETEIGDGQKVSWGTFFLQHGDLKRHVKDGIAALTGDASRNLLITVSEGNKLTYYDLKTLEPRFTVQIRNDNQWLATDNRGYFTSSLNGTQGTFWNLGENFLPFAALKDKYENDRAVRQTLTQLFKGGDSDDAKLVIEPDVIEMPFKVTLTSERDLITRDEQYRVTLTIEKDDKRIEDPQLYFLINGRRSRGFDQDPFADLEEKLTYIRTLPLGIGENVIEAVINHKGVDVHKEVITVMRERNPQASLQDKTLWFFGVGVSEYQNTLQNLEFADRDALELEKLFLSQKGKLFTDVKTRVLTNRQATAREVKIELHEFFADASPNDEIVIFLAGHGIQDSHQALYFMPHDGDMKRPFTGMPMDDFRLFLQQRPLNQRALFLLDICHAGAFDNSGASRLTAEDVIKELSSGTATTVFSSSTGAQQSFEDERFGGGHGAFTYSLLKALRGEADRETGDLDGINSLLEVIVYSRREVPRLTNQAQSPTVPVMSSFEDYALSSVTN